VDRDDLNDLIRQRAEIGDRLRELNSKLQENHDERQRLDADKQRIMDNLEAAPDEADRDVIALETDDIYERQRQLVEEALGLIKDSEKAREADAEISKRIDEALEKVRVAAIESEKMLFEVFKLVATLGIAASVAIAAVTPALLPKLNSFEGLWPVYEWLLASIAASVIACAVLAFSISNMLMPARRARRSRMPGWVRRLIGASVYAVLFSFSLAGLLWGLFGFVLFISTQLN
jgi:hypothetical protein